MLCKQDITVMGTETVRYKVQPLGSNVCNVNSKCFLSVLPATPATPEPIAFYLHS
jgi:hypothetical protein